jgi:hypothetical protein
MNNIRQDYLNCGKSEYTKQNKGYTLHSMATKNFGMANSVSTIYYGSVSHRVDGHETISMSQSPIVIKSKDALDEAIHFLKSSGLLPLYSYLTVREVNYLRVYYQSKDRYGKPKDVLGDQITSVIFEKSLEQETPNFKF